MGNPDSLFSGISQYNHPTTTPCLKIMRSILFKSLFIFAQFCHERLMDFFGSFQLNTNISFWHSFIAISYEAHGNSFFFRSAPKKKLVVMKKIKIKMKKGMINVLVLRKTTSYSQNPFLIRALQKKNSYFFFFLLGP
jgi:hypothetical protein